MKRQREDHLRWFLSEIPALRESDTVSADTLAILEARYRAELEADSSSRTRGSRKLVFALISVIASLFIAGGVISFIAWNWHVIPIGAKSVLAILVLLIPQVAGGCFLFLSRKAATLPGREGIGILHAILFGAAMAFLGQIWQIPQDLPFFLLLWALSSLACAYLYRSVSALTLGLLLAVIMTGLQDSSGMIYLLFPLLAAAAPFAVFGRKTDSPARNVYANWIFVAATVAGLFIFVHRTEVFYAIALFPEVFAALALAGRLLEKEDIPNSRKPLRLSGSIGLCVSLCVITQTNLWDNLYFSHSFSFGIGFSLLSLFFVLLVAAVGGIQLFRERRMDSSEILILIAGILPVVLLWIATTAHLGASLESSWDYRIPQTYLIPPYFPIYLLAFGALSAGVILHMTPEKMGTNKKLLPSCLLLLAAGMPFIICRDLSFPFTFLCFPAIAFACTSVYWTGVALDVRGGGKTARNVRTLGILAVSLSVLFFTTPFSEGLTRDLYDRENLPFASIMLLIFIALPLLAAWRYRKSERRPNFVSAFYPLFMGIFAVDGLFQQQPRELAVWCDLIFMGLIAFEGFRIGISRKSLIAVNASGILLISGILARFFDESTTFLLKAAVLTACGIGLFAVNAVLAGSYRKEARNG
jgi:uncharacterized membrane protein